MGLARGRVRDRSALPRAVLRVPFELGSRFRDEVLDCEVGLLHARVQLRSVGADGENHLQPLFHRPSIGHLQRVFTGKSHLFGERGFSGREKKKKQEYRHDDAHRATHAREEDRQEHDAI